MRVVAIVVLLLALTATAVVRASQVDADTDADVDADTEADAEVDSELEASLEAQTAQTVDAVESQMIDAALSVDAPDWDLFVHRHLMPNNVMELAGGYVTAGAIADRASGAVLGKSEEWRATKKEVKKLIRGLSNIEKLRKKGEVVIADVKYKIQSAAAHPTRHVVAKDANGAQIYAALTKKAVVIQTSSVKPASWWTERARKMVRRPQPCNAPNHTTALQTAYLEKNEL